LDAEEGMSTDNMPDADVDISGSEDLVLHRK
jgi:hypothetical protein